MTRGRIGAVEIEGFVVWALATDEEFFAWSSAPRC
jgi:hypothetical protein